MATNIINHRDKFFGHTGNFPKIEQSREIAAGRQAGKQSTAP